MKEVLIGIIVIIGARVIYLMNRLRKMNAEVSATLSKGRKKRRAKHATKSKSAKEAYYNRRDRFGRFRTSGKKSGRS